MMYRGEITALRDKGSSVDIVIRVKDHSLPADEKARFCHTRKTSGYRGK